jgi:hypothetical protein
LAKVRDGLNSISHNKQKAARTARDEIAQHIRRELGMETAPNLVDCIKGRFVIGDTFGQEVSVELHPAQEFFRWLKYQINKKRLYGVVEVSSVFSRSNIDDRHLQHLRRLAQNGR